MKPGDPTGKNCPRCEGAITFAIVGGTIDSPSLLARCERCSAYPCRAHGCKPSEDCQDCRWLCLGGGGQHAVPRAARYLEGARTCPPRCSVRESALDRAASGRMLS